MFAGPPRSGPQCPGIRALDDKPNTEINAFQGKPKKQGKLTPEERKHHMDNNLCLYCGKPGHKAQDCRAPLNQFPKAPIWRIDTIPEEDKSIKKPDTEINVLDLNQFAVLASLNPDEMNLSPDFWITLLPHRQWELCSSLHVPPGLWLHSKRRKPLMYQ